MHAPVKSNLACVATVSFPFQVEIERKRAKSGRKEHAWGEKKNWGVVGRPVSFSSRKFLETLATQAKSIRKDLSTLKISQTSHT